MSLVWLDGRKVEPDEIDRVLSWTTKPLANWDCERSHRRPKRMTLQGARWGPWVVVERIGSAPNPQAGRRNQAETIPVWRLVARCCGSERLATSHQVGARLHDKRRVPGELCIECLRAKKHAATCATLARCARTPCRWCARPCVAGYQLKCRRAWGSRKHVECPACTRRANRNGRTPEGQPIWRHKARSNQRRTA